MADSRRRTTQGDRTPERVHQAAQAMNNSVPSGMQRGYIPQNTVGYNPQNTGGYQAAGYYGNQQAQYSGRQPVNNQNTGSMQY